MTLSLHLDRSSASFSTAFVREGRPIRDAATLYWCMAFTTRVSMCELMSIETCPCSHWLLSYHLRSF